MCAQKLFNTLTNQLEELTTTQAGKVSMYSCGPTVYNHVHIGNGRAFITADLVYRYLCYAGYDVTFVQNYTDVDDKIIEQARIEGLTSEALAEKYIESVEEDFRTLRVKKPTFRPRATAHIQEMLDVIESLIKKGFAYVVDGEVLFEISRFESYGKLSKKNIDDLKAGARVEVAQYKRNPFDFSLWKPAKPGEPSWDSPWGKGRPGWHIECSAMAMKYLGNTVDVHLGGIDLIFPHHENEIAQSEAYTNTKFCNCWVHNGFLNFGSEKMSKSLGNIVSLKKFLEEHGTDTLRLMFYNVHYRSPLDFDEGTLETAQGFQDRLYNVKFLAEKNLKSPGKVPVEVLERLTNFDKFLRSAMDEDFAAPRVMAEIMSIVRTVNQIAETQKGKIPGPLAIALQEFFQIIDEVFGIATLDADGYREEKISRWEKRSGKSRAFIEQLISDRNTARSQKDFNKADGIRKQLSEMRIVINDSPTGTLWIPEG